MNGEASGGLMKKIALAPERQGVEEFVKQVTEEGSSCFS